MHNCFELCRVSDHDSSQPHVIYSRAHLISSLQGEKEPVNTPHAMFLSRSLNYWIIQLIERSTILFCLARACISIVHIHFLFLFLFSHYLFVLSVASKIKIVRSVFLLSFLEQICFIYRKNFAFVYHFGCDCDSISGF